jgi:hypothetical protein
MILMSLLDTLSSQRDYDMNENLTNDDSVARDRLTLDITDLKGRIEACREDDPAWRELSLSGKIRALVVKQLELLEREQDATVASGKPKVK